MLGVFFYSTSIKELHYAFSSQYHSSQHEKNCDHHIHSSDKEGDCAICKIDVIGLFHTSEPHYCFSILFLSLGKVQRPETVVFFIPQRSNYLRGPPSQA
jgi:hypothetical protein